MRALVFLWDNFGPMHYDRVNAVLQHFSGTVNCIGIEEVSKSDIYDWEPTANIPFEKVTLGGHPRLGSMQMLFALIRQEIRTGKATWFLCNYNAPHVIIFSFYLKLRFRDVFLMGCSKFDDKQRFLFSELLKFVIMLPYSGIIASGLRSKEYFRFLSLRPVVGEYNTLSISRIRSLSGGQPAPHGISFEDRDFLIVARLVEKKDLSTALHAYAKFLKIQNSKRKLIICGSGELHSELRELASSLAIADSVVFEGFVQTEGIARIMAKSLALILPSLEEQFGNVVIEAQAMGLPVLVSNVCGACDLLVQSWVNGFVFEPHNTEGLAHFMGMLSSDKVLWEKMCEKANATSELGDAARFSEGVALLTMGKT